MFAREQAAQHFAALLDRPAEDEAIGPREIDVLENAVLQRLFGRETQRLDAALRDAQHFAGLDVAHVVAPIKSNAQVSEATIHAPSSRPRRQRAESARIAQRVHFVARQHQQRIRALDLVQRVAERAGKIPRLAARHQVHDHFGVAGGLENRAAMFERAAQFAALGRLPLWPRASLPLLQSITIGCAFISEVSPAVE